MNRRNFLSLAMLAVAGEAAVRTWPFRVFSIPKELVIPKGPCLTIEMLRIAQKQIMERLGQPEEIFVTPAYQAGLFPSPYPPGIWPVEEVSLEELRRRYPMHTASVPYLHTDV